MATVSPSPSPSPLLLFPSSSKVEPEAAGTAADSMASVSPSPLLPPPSSSKVQPETAGRAVDALLKWSKSRTEDQKPQLLEQDDFFYLILTLRKIPPKGRTNPYKIPLPHSLHPMDASEQLCLIIDDRSKSALSSESAKKKIKAEDIPISKVLKLSKLKTDYRPFEAKRKLCDSYDMFFADKRIIPLLPKLLGKQFFKKKKIPVPIELTHKNWKEQIERASGSALLYLRTGTCSVIKVGKVSQSKDELIENVIAAVQGIVEIVPKKWANVRSLHLKMSESLALPIYQAVPDMGLKIEGVKKHEEIEAETEPSEEKKNKLGKKKVSKKGRIHEVRYMDDVPGEVLDAIAGEVSDVVAEDKKIENVELGSAELKGKKRKQAEKSKKERVLDVSNEKQGKKPAMLKKGDAAKQGGVLDGSNEKQLKKPAMIKKGDAAKQERVIDGSNEKQLKKPAKVKKVEAVKSKDGLFSKKTGNEVVGGTPSSNGLKKNKKNSKSGTLESGEKKMKSKKNRTKSMA